MPLYGKLADVFGRRRIFLFGMSLFLLGSLLCGVAQGMTSLIVFRALQGLGASAVTPTVLTIVADLYPLHERARVQAVFSTLWGVASLAGPGAGAWLTLTFSWRSVFFVGLPFGLAAAIVLIRFFKEHVKPRKVSLDVAGTVLLMGSLTAFLMALMAGGDRNNGASLTALSLLVATVVILGGFIVAERRAAEPVLPLSLFRLRVMSVSAVCNTLSSAVQYGVSSYVPLYVQGALGEGAGGAGAVLTPMLASWSVGGLLGPRLLLRVGYRVTAICATLLVALGAVGLYLLTPDSPGALRYVSMSLLGLGFGPSTAAFMVAVQEKVPWQQRGVATSATQLFSSLGGTIGVALLGTIFQAVLTSWIAAVGLDPSAVSGLLEASAGPTSGALVGLRLVLAEALRPVFAVIMLLSLISLTTVVLFAHDGGVAKRARQRGQARAGLEE
jgi:MFS family permease